MNQHSLAFSFRFRFTFFPQRSGCTISYNVSIPKLLQTTLFSFLTNKNKLKITLRKKSNSFSLFQLHQHPRSIRQSGLESSPVFIFRSQRLSPINHDNGAGHFRENFLFSTFYLVSRSHRRFRYLLLIVSVLFSLSNFELLIRTDVTLCCRREKV